MVDCICGFAKNIKESQSKCFVCGTDLTLLHKMKALPGACYSEGVESLHDGRIDEAMERFFAAITLNSSDPGPYSEAGKAYALKGLYAEALGYYAKAVALDPDNNDFLAAKKDIEEKIDLALYQTKETEKARERAREDASREIELLRTNKSELVRRTSFLKKLVIGISSLAFVSGLVLTQAYSYSRATTPRQEYDYSAKALAVKKLISQYGDLAGLDLGVSHSTSAIILSGVVPTGLHRDLVMAVAAVEAGEIPMDVDNLAVKPKDTENNFLYTVKAGDSLSRMSYLFYNDYRRWGDIYGENRDKLQNPDRVLIGQVLKIPIIEGKGPAEEQK